MNRQQEKWTQWNHCIRESTPGMRREGGEQTTSTYVCLLLALCSIHWFRLLCRCCGHTWFVVEHGLRQIVPGDPPLWVYARNRASVHWTLKQLLSLHVGALVLLPLVFAVHFNFSLCDAMKRNTDINYSCFVSSCISRIMVTLTTAITLQTQSEKARTIPTQNPHRLGRVFWFKNSMHASNNISISNGSFSHFSRNNASLGLNSKSGIYLHQYQDINLKIWFWMLWNGKLSFRDPDGAIENDSFPTCDVWRLVALYLGTRV